MPIAKPTLLLTSVLLASTVLAGSPTAQFGQWNIAYPEPSGEWFYAAAWGDSGCVAVGMHGDIAFSPDGVSWREVRSPLKQIPGTKDCTLFDVCYGDGIYVAVGGLYNKAYAVRSTDGIHWETVDPDVFTYLRGVCHGDGRFVAVVGSAVTTSIDGRTWESLPPSPGIWRIAHGDGRWIGISGSGDYHWTDDLATWTTVAGDSRSFSQRNICHGAGRFVAVGSWGGSGSSSIIQWSETGTNWHFATTEESVWGDQQGCTYANGRFVVTGARNQDGYHPRTTLVSTNGAAWSGQRTVSPANVHVPNGYLLDVAGFDGNPFVAVGNHGVIWSSTNATDWTVVDPRPREYLNSIKYANGSYVAVGGRAGYIGYPPGACAIFSSTNGVDWRSYVPNRPDTLWDVAYGNGTWVATGDDGGIFTSTDAFLWTDRSWPDTLNDLEHVVYGNGRFIAFSKNRDRIYHSEDALHWEISDGAPVANVRCAAFFDDRFIACGENGLVLFSTNGLEWVDNSITNAIDIYAVGYGKGRFVLSGSDQVAVSTNGIDWTIAAHRLSPNEIHYANGWFIGNNLEISRDGLHWQPAPDDFFPDYSRFESMAVVSNQLVAIDGMELWSATLSFTESQGLMFDLASGLEFWGQSNKLYQLQQSHNLHEWTPQGIQHQGSNDFIVWEAGLGEKSCFWKMEVSESE